MKADDFRRRPTLCLFMNASPYFLEYEKYFCDNPPFVANKR
ncbi:hypothetical protein NEIELOOT_02207 [Neisseria elongata subsp. glycolytica ATCC 29315]|uniref:Uncharacterized protein n=1 Tax=Neisseria elongata subsp. glycolytica ATCC 29315 TaxID=546263 RepID=D4DT10_NEIEG|nr:hypothetical protein NEIELOOT_02207 [Neisseria elongata subsp. glycolytica ATCC 29315]